jgi:hypothetical protein
MGNPKALARTEVACVVMLDFNAELRFCRPEVSASIAFADTRWSLLVVAQQID